MNYPRPPLVIAELSTARLVLRRLDPTLDSTDLFEMDADPLVHRFVYGSRQAAGLEVVEPPEDRPWGRPDLQLRPVVKL